MRQDFGSLPRAKSPLGVGSELSLARRPLHLARKSTIEGVKAGPRMADIGIPSHGAHVRAIAAPNPAKIPGTP